MPARHIVQSDSFPYLCRMQILHKYLILAIILQVGLYSCSDPGNADEYYRNGRAKLDKHNYPEAVNAFLHAENIARECGNDSLEVLSQRAMMDLHDSVCDANGKARYAFKACEIYARHKDYDSIYAVLSRFTGVYHFETPPYEYMDEFRHYTKLLLENDTTRAYFYADTLERRSKHLYYMLSHLGTLDAYSFRFIDDLKEFNPQILIDKIKNDGDWREDVANDSADISATDAHMIATVLLCQGFEDKADDFINYYKWKYSDKIIKYYD